MEPLQKHLLSLLVIAIGINCCLAAEYDYGKVLGASTLFYEAQRTGKLPADNRVKWRGDSFLDDKGDGGEDLTGGYFDGKLTGDLSVVNLQYIK